MKNILIVGGSSGIGATSTDFFKEKGWNVISTFFSHERHVDGVSFSFLDITDTQLVVDFVKHLPMLDALVVCACLNEESSLQDFDIDSARKVFEVNVVAQINLLSLLLEKMNKGSSTVFFGSITAKIGSMRRVAYSASKASMYGFIASASAELSPDIRVNAIFPGYIETEQYKKNSSIPKQIREKNILLGRLGNPQEVAKLVYFLASEDSSYITGQCIHIDGGVF
jgi:NAD(P)-dependent dehydrogenase (short-subunit alcohol dehydrogenase family)